MYRLYHLIFLIHLNRVLLFLRIYLFFTGKQEKQAIKKVAALPYYPKGGPGGEERIANWKSYFEKDGINFDVFWASEKKEFYEYLETESQFKRYRFFSKVLRTRARQFLKLKNYDAIWIQRGYVPSYPFKDAYFEKLLQKLHPNVIQDFYDADYESNYPLTVNAAKRASKVSVASQHLVSFFEKQDIATHFLPFAIAHESYTQKQDYASKEEIVIGWMGSPENSKQLQLIESQLLAVMQQNTKVKLSVLCRQPTKMDLPNMEIRNWDEAGFDYHQWIASLDIGVVPYPEFTERVKAKTAMKSLEFMASGVPAVLSPHGISDQLKHQKNALIAPTTEDWQPLLQQLIDSSELRKELGTKALQAFLEYHTYEAGYQTLKKILSNE
jgi:glycosyltransferase involved in cell wall biosynthesis